jgi:hypothetical protein
MSVVLRSYIEARVKQRQAERKFREDAIDVDICPDCGADLKFYRSEDGDWDEEDIDTKWCRVCNKIQES